MSAQIAEAFRKAVMMMKLLKNSAVVVGLSGSSDSVALTYLAKQNFDKVLAMTVNLNMNEENDERAAKAAEIARALGVDHRVVKLDWTEGGKKTESMARHRCYPALMDQCRKMGARILMVAHSQDNQIEQMVYRMSKASGMEGLGGLQPLSYWANYPDISIARPFLDCSRMSLEELCKEAGLLWLDRGSSGLERERFRSIGRRHEGLRDGLMELMSLCREARALAHPHAVEEIVKQLPTVDSTHGALSFPTSIYGSLNPAIARRALGHWIRYIGGVSDIRYDVIVAMQRFINSPDNRSNLTASKILMTFDPNGKRLTMSRQLPEMKYQTRVPIRVGETVFWDNRFEISLVPHRNTWDPANRDTAHNNPSETSVYYIRHLLKRDWPYMSKGGARYKVPVNVRGGLPVVVNEENNIVLMPHFNVARRDAGVFAIVKFKPLRSIEDLLQQQFTYYHEC